MRSRAFRATAFLSLVAGAGCADTGVPTGPGQRVSIQVAPLTLPGIGYACYDVKVSTGLGGTETVWSQGDPDWTQVGADQTAPAPGDAGDGPSDATTLCSDQFGNTTGGDIAYIGTCDATVDSDGFAGNGVQNRVTLWVDGLYTAGGAALGEWQDPCPNGCTLDVDCTENADSLARFDLTIMRDANQGFFDVAVNFSDVFCSAKLDTCYADGPDADESPDRIELLFGGDQTRDWTAVYGFACTGGAGPDVETTLLYSKVLVKCSGPEVTFEVDPKADPGDAEVTVDGHTLHYAVYRGVEDLDCGEATSCNKAYWNLAFDLADLSGFAGCSLALESTAHDGTGFADGLPTATGLAYPYIRANLGLTKQGPWCQQNPLNGVDPLNESDSLVTTVYEGSVNGIEKPTVMCHQSVGGAVSATGGCGAPALIVQHTFTGTEDGTGTSFVATLTYDANQVPLWSEGAHAQYVAFDVALTVGGRTIHGDPGAGLRVINDESYGDVIMTDGTGTGIGFNFRWGGGAAFSSTALPTALSLDGVNDSYLVEVGGSFYSVTGVSSQILP